jgi:membrane fusion protein (multidrug efflux system)
VSRHDLDRPGSTASGRCPQRRHAPCARQAVLALVFALATGAAPGTSAAQARAPTPAKTSAAPPASGADQALATRLKSLEIRAQLTPRRYTTLAAEVGARIQRLPVAEGGAFAADQTLVVFDCTVQQAQLDKARAELDAAQSTLKSNERLLELNSVGQLELELSRSAVGRARAELGMHEAVLSRCAVRAPWSGRVAEQKAREQQFVQPGQPLLEILDDSALELEFLVPSSWLVWLRPGQRLRVQIDETRRSYPARFVRIGARADPVSQSVKVAAAIDGRFPELVAGMSGRIQPHRR